MPRRRSALLLCLAAPLALPAQEAPPIDFRLQGELERLYGAWKQSFLQRDLAAWSRHTARARQVKVRNTIVSQRREWPRALFTLPMVPPDLTGLKLLTATSRQDQARLVYHGRVDFGLDAGSTPPEAMLILDFVKEPAGWKYYAGRYLNPREDGELIAAARRGDYSFLAGTGLELTGTAPAVPPLVPRPDFAAQLQVDCPGYTVHLQINEHHREVFTGTGGTSPLNGGLRRGLNKLQLTATPLADVPEKNRRLVLKLFRLRDGALPPATLVHEYAPTPVPAGRQEFSFLVAGPND